MNIVERLKDSLDYEYNLSFSERKQLLEEIERLNNLNKQLVEECQRLDDEETRLNNILDELEEYCWELKAMGCREGALDMLDKIEELKNGDNNE